MPRDGVPEAFELGDETVGEALGVGAAGEVVGAEIVVGDVVLEDVVGGYEDGEGATATIAFLCPWRRLTCSYWARR